MKIPAGLKREIMKAYTELDDLPISAFIKVKLENNTILEYNFFEEFIIRDMSEKETLLMKDNVNVVIVISGFLLIAYSCQNDELPCSNDEMKKLIGDTVTHSQQDDVYAVIVQNEGIHCYGDTLSEVIQRCKVITDTIADSYYAHLS